MRVPFADAFVASKTCPVERGVKKFVFMEFNTLVNIIFILLFTSIML